MTSIIEPAAGPGLRHALTFTLDNVEWRDSGDPDRKSETTLRGHAAVFNRLSDDLGGFRELLEPGAFRAALRKQPDAKLLYNHDPNYVLARTMSGSLELREDTEGLHVFARVDRRISWVEDLRTSMMRGDVDQMSFAFTVADGGDDWATADGDIIRTIRQDGVSDLFDVSIVTYPAYPQTSVNMRSLLDIAIGQGRIQGIEPASAGSPAESPNPGGSGAHLARARAIRRARLEVERTPTRKESSE